MIKIYDELYSSKENTTKDAGLIAWLMPRIQSWIDHRELNYTDKWREYERIWRGIWDASDKTRQSERSKLISPATQQAVEATVAELEEAIFGRGTWFDIRDDPADKDTSDVEYLKNRLSYDLEKTGTKSAIAEAFLNAALYGTGIIEITVEEQDNKTPTEITRGGITARGVVSNSNAVVKWNPISPLNFFIDPNSTSIKAALGCGIESKESLHTIIPKIQNGVYLDVDIGSFSNDSRSNLDDSTSINDNADYVKITKYYGMCPKNLIDEVNGVISEENDVMSLEKDEVIGQDTDIDTDDDLVECIVVIANDSVILKAIVNPYMMGDRPVIAFPLDLIPGKFHGRGVVEKGYNPQKALDAELRARIDALALTTHPMMGIDATRLPRGAKFQVQPGQTLLSNGDPREVFMPLNFGQLNPINFQASADMERMIQMATGAIDTAMPVGSSPRNATASGMSMMMSAAIKRQKRTILNIQDKFLIPGISMTAYRYMQFRPDIYPIKDVNFIPSSTMGIMAREYEQQQFIQLLSMAPQGSPLFMLLMKSIYENSSLSHREEAISMLNQMMQPSQPDPMQQQMMQLEMLDKQKSVEYKAAQTTQIQHSMSIQDAEIQLDYMKLGQDKSPVDPQEMQYKYADLMLREKEFDHISKKDIADLTLREIQINKDHHVKMSQLEQAAYDKMQQQQQPEDRPQSAPIHLNLNVDAKQGKVKKKINRDAEGNITSIEDDE